MTTFEFNNKYTSEGQKDDFKETHVFVEESNNESGSFECPDKSKNEVTNNTNSSHARHLWVEYSSNMFVEAH